MIDLTKEINKKFNNNYDYLRLLGVVYDKSQFCCTITFLFPQTINEISDESREEIYNFLTELLGLNANLVVKYKKSFLDEHLIKDEILNFFKLNNSSLYTSINKNNISITTDISVNVKLNMPNEFLDYITQNNIQNQLKFHLERQFIGEFYVDLYCDNQTVDETILQYRKDNMEIPTLKKVIRYEVFHPEILLGKDISPYPELINNQKGEKEQVILAGTISGITKKEYKSKRNKNPDVVNHFYTFTLNDTTATIPCIHFSSKTNEPKLDKLVEGLPYLFQGDIRKNSFGKTQYYIRYINACEFSLKSIEKATNVVQEEPELTLSNNYQFIKPQPYLSLTQSKLFDNVYYNDFIMYNTFVVFDVETTGLDAGVNEIIEIGACKVENGAITQTFQSLVKPKTIIPDLITKLTGIDNDMVKDAYDINKVLTDFILFCQGSVLSGYNVGFDMKFIQNAGAQIGYTFENRVEDTMVFAREKMFLKSYTLKNVAKNLEVSLNNAHRALNDAIATANVLLKLNIREKI